MTDYPFTLTAVLIVALVAYFRYRRSRGQDAEWERKHPRENFKYFDKTLLFYDSSHGNQIEYLDRDGYCYLWYPGNTGIVIGRWRVDEANIYFQYGSNTFNPVVGIRGGSWEPCPIFLWATSIMEDVPGDPLGLKTKLPYILIPHQQINSIRDLLP